jgi:hypothetical protein
MRIRTVKPEFWTHPVMLKQSDFNKLLAIALLNYADDEGYFYADDDLIRGSLFPKEQSTKIRRAIDDLSRIGYLTVKIHVTHGPIGFIDSFAKHQKIDRPKQSKIKDLYTIDDESTIDRRLIDDASLLDQVSGNREQGIGNREITKVINGKKSKSQKPEMEKPSIEEVSEFTISLGLTQSDGEYIFRNWVDNDWRNTKTKDPIKDWKNTIRKWKSANYFPSQKQTNGYKNGSTPKLGSDGNELFDRNNPKRFVPQSTTDYDAIAMRRQKELLSRILPKQATHETNAKNS